MAELRVSAYDDPAPFLEHAEAWLMGAEAEHNLILGIAEGLRRRGSPGGEARPFFAVVEVGGRVAGCAFRTPPHKLGVTRMPDAAATRLAEEVAARFDALPAVFGPRHVAEAFARAWSQRTGARWRLGMDQRIYRLDEVRPPTGVPGRIRAATREDLTVVADLADGFAADTGVEFETSKKERADWVKEGCVFLWEDEGPVSMAVAKGATRHGIRVGYVYTPPERRRRGYASALVAQLSHRMLSEGFRFCVLYTDLSNPTSNAIYARVGYEPICDVVDVNFGM